MKKKVKKGLKKERVIVEKEGLLALAIVLLTAGMVMIQQSTMAEPIKLIGGAVLMVIGIVILAGRGELKLNRYSHMDNGDHVPTLWRGVDLNGDKGHEEDEE